MSDGLFLAFSDPGSVPEEEFHDWYDNEHLPARLAVPGFHSAARYRAADGAAPPWLAVYDIDPGTLQSRATARNTCHSTTSTASTSSTMMNIKPPPRRPGGTAS